MSITNVRTCGETVMKGTQRVMRWRISLENWAETFTSVVKISGYQVASVGELAYWVPPVIGAWSVEEHSSQETGNDWWWTDATVTVYCHTPSQ
jgi:hypothetical protein